MLDMHIGRTDLPGEWRRYQVEDLRATAPTTPSVQQAAGGGNATTIRVNETAGHVVLPGRSGQGTPSIAERVAEADVVLVNAQVAWLALLQDRYLTRVAYRRYDTGVVAYATVEGTAAAHGSAVKPTPAQIQAAVGAGNPWISLYSVLVYRSADAVIAETRSNTERPFGVDRSDDVLRTSEL
jgi:hypothetical protein